MKTRWIVPYLVAGTLVAGVIGPRALAADLGPVKQRMAQRLPAIDALKDRGVVGENNRGYLEARSALSGEEKGTMEGENSDRSAVYAALAQQTGSSSEQVGRARAKQIAQNSRAGVWLQDENGRWHRK
ncbi:MAG TPA: YdbL family protein [Opitutaceae bacterium]|nr:YdbL family protein [Opitutaceae bacterium]